MKRQQRTSTVSHPRRSASNSVHETNGLHEGVDHLSERAARLVHHAIDAVSDRTRSGADAIVESGKHAKQYADERIQERPLLSVGVAFAAGMLTSVLIRSFRRG